MPAGEGKREWRAYVSEDLLVLLERLLPLLDGEEDWNKGTLTEEAFIQFLHQPAVAHLIRRYRLVENLKTEGRSVEFLKGTGFDDGTAL